MYAGRLDQSLHTVDCHWKLCCQLSMIGICIPLTKHLNVVIDLEVCRNTWKFERNSRWFISIPSLGILVFFCSCLLSWPTISRL